MHLPPSEIVHVHLKSYTVMEIANIWPQHIRKSKHNAKLGDFGCCSGDDERAQCGKQHNANATRFCNIYYLLYVEVKI